LNKKLNFSTKSKSNGDFEQTQKKKTFR